MTATPTEMPSIPKSNFDVPDPLDLRSLKGKVSDEEWRLRCDLAATYRLTSLFGWDDLIFTHISLRLPEENGKKRFLLNPYGVTFDEMTASSLLVVDENGETIGDTPYFSNPAGFTIHSAVHQAREDAHCVLHLHSPFGVAVSAQPDGLLPITQFSMIVLNDLAYHDYEGLATNLGERERIVRDLRSRNFLMLRNHGTLTVGENCPLAFLRMYFLEQACKAQVLAQTSPKNPLVCNEALNGRVFEQAKPAFAHGFGDNLSWPGLIRRLKRANPGYDV